MYVLNVDSSLELYLSHRSLFVFLVNAIFYLTVQACDFMWLVVFFVKLVPWFRMTKDTNYAIA